MPLIPSTYCMQSGMTRMRDYRQIFWMVVKFIPVQVVRVLSELQFAPKALLQHGSMLIHTLAIYGNSAVPILHDITTAIGSAFRNKWRAIFKPSKVVHIAPSMRVLKLITALNVADFTHPLFEKWITVQMPSTPMPLAITAAPMLSITILNGACFHYACC